MCAKKTERKAHFRPHAPQTATHHAISAGPNLEKGRVTKTTVSPEPQCIVTRG